MTATTNEPTAIIISAGQCHYEGADDAEHAARMSVFLNAGEALVCAAYPDAKIKLTVRGDDGATRIVCDDESEIDGTADRVRDHVRELLGVAWMTSCEVTA